MYIYCLVEHTCIRWEKVSTPKQHIGNCKSNPIAKWRISAYILTRIWRNRTFQNTFWKLCEFARIAMKRDVFGTWIPWGQHLGIAFEDKTIGKFHLPELPSVNRNNVRLFNIEFRYFYYKIAKHSRRNLIQCQIVQYWNSIRL